MHYYIEPEVAGGLGETSIIDTSCHPPKITRLEYKFEGWLGDDLLEGFPCFIVTKRLADAISKKRLSGFCLKPLKISKSENFLELYPDLKLPDFKWLEIVGSAGVDDLGLAENHILVVSELALNVFKELKINQAELKAFPEN
ncbi:hypothetical protein V2K69_14345 [Pseudomonas alliivorans]|nr:hypothetical protein [Pseudomonas alliivorans]MEE4717211.1 hypothetical protein [Pseudomonas alliivorans]MEE4722231.1 hypothetical protein [Pseudomonas alliivorans]MEE4757971.1 hypothetical protein [Pseudomonas alliivorans]MEE4762800.1 hypothetical protein [Pseudomonas alliivorans]